MKGEERFHGSIKIYLRTKQGVEHTDALTAAILLPNDHTTLCDLAATVLGRRMCRCPNEGRRRGNDRVRSHSDEQNRGPSSLIVCHFGAIHS